MHFKLTSGCLSALPEPLVYLEVSQQSHYQSKEDADGFTYCLQNMGPVFQAIVTSNSLFPDRVQIYLPLDSMEYYSHNSRLKVSRCDDSQCHKCGEDRLVWKFVGMSLFWLCYTEPKGKTFKIEASHADTVYFCNLGVWGTN